MSHTYHDEESGLRFHYNSDLSGDVDITAPGKETVTIPGEALGRFFALTLFDVEEFVGWLDRIKEWLTKHSYAGIEEEVPTLVKGDPKVGLE